MQGIQEVTKNFREQFKTGGVLKFSPDKNELLVMGNYLKKISSEMGINDNYELLNFFANLNEYMEFIKDFKSW